MVNPELLQLIDAQQGRLQQLQQLLQQEHQALVERDADAIESLLREKLAQLDAINAADTALAGHPDVAQLANDAEARQGIEQCRSVLTQCQMFNQQNSQLADQTLASLSRLQQILNSTKSANSLTYNQSGTTSSGNRLGKAIKA
ncbi:MULTISPECIES: flagellar export chaperone FlgN [Ferrimonas]|uniref:flagellar export chaperone FlgN n=1 Tax=Ferrimonas TaxID=44011 RepID=UPI000688A75B|nr:MULTISPECIES: flagellar export chaperone FlgN [Ferrimonas]USD38601.1 flagellar export chaperone FlgN [Ferrimonas sp. SCSIO 43195]